MDLDEFRSVLKDAGVDVWSFIETAISVARADYGDELKDKRDGIVAQLYKTSVPRCRNCCDLEEDHPRVPNGRIEEEEEMIKNDRLLLEEAEANSIEKEKVSSHDENGANSPFTPQSNDREEEDHPDRTATAFDLSFDSEQRKILAIKEHLEDPYQSDDSLVDLLQNLSDMDITFKALQETDIGRYVNGLRKHSSGEVRKLVKLLVRKWKDLVDEWVKSNASGGTAVSAIIVDGDSPRQMPAKSIHIGNQILDFGYSPNHHHNESAGPSKQTPSLLDAKGASRREVQTKKSQSPTVSTPANAKQKELKEIDPEKLASARRRLQENYQEAQNAKKQRTIQKLDLHDIPKSKNSFFSRNKGGVQARPW